MSVHEQTRPADSRGFTLLETMIAAVLLLVVFFALAQTYTRGRTQVDYEEDRRVATEVAQMRLDGLRRDYRYDDLPALAGSDTTYVVGRRRYTVSHEVTPGSPEDQATTITITVSWVARVGGTDVSRTFSATTVLGRGMP
jgi:prepilin-type N-terminal cleavage/methylation domain-containing protein